MDCFPFDPLWCLDPGKGEGGRCVWRSGQNGGGVDREVEKSGSTGEPPALKKVFPPEKEQLAKWMIILRMKYLLLGVQIFGIKEPGDVALF